MTRKKLFVTLPSDVAKGSRIELRVTDEEAQKIRHLARIRQMTVSDFVRRAALGRATPVDLETDLVLALSDVVRRIRELHKAVKETGAAPLDEQLLPVILDAKDTILRVAASR